MKIDLQYRIKIWKKLAQTTTTTISPTPISSSNLQAPPIALTQIPTFKPALFDAHPDIINDLTKVANIINKYMFQLSNGQVDFSLTWKRPGTDVSAFSNGLKAFIGLAKWLAGILSANNPQPYTIDGLAKIAQDLIAIVPGYDIPEALASSAKNEIITAARQMLNKLGVV